MVGFVDVQNRNLKAIRKKQKIPYTDKCICITVEFFPTQIVMVKRDWNEVFQAIKENNFQSRLKYFAKIISKLMVNNNEYLH